MDQQHLVQQLIVQHQHTDGAWASMSEDRTHHDAADHDMERAWANRRIYKCTTCDETVTISEAGPAANETR